jgi:hypothetical protein
MHPFALDVGIPFSRSALRGRTQNKSPLRGRARFVPEHQRSAKRSRHPSALAPHSAVRNSAQCAVRWGRSRQFNFAILELFPRIEKSGEHRQAGGATHSAVASRGRARSYKGPKPPLSSARRSIWPCRHGRSAIKRFRPAARAKDAPDRSQFPSRR